MLPIGSPLGFVFYPSSHHSGRAAACGWLVQREFSLPLDTSRSRLRVAYLEANISPEPVLDGSHIFQLNVRSCSAMNSVCSCRASYSLFFFPPSCF